MGDVKGRTNQTSRAVNNISPWNGDGHTYSVSAINLGNNFIAKIEIVSSLNLFNSGRSQYYFTNRNCTNKYNPKVFVGAVQIESAGWNYDDNSSVQNVQKSGSWL